MITKVSTWTYKHTNIKSVVGVLIREQGEMERRRKRRWRAKVANYYVESDEVNHPIKRANERPSDCASALLHAIDRRAL